MTRTSATADGLATNDMARYYARFAQGGNSLVAEFDYALLQPLANIKAIELA